RLLGVGGPVGRVGDDDGERAVGVRPDLVVGDAAGVALGGQLVGAHRPVPELGTARHGMGAGIGVGEGGQLGVEDDDRSVAPAEHGVHVGVVGVVEEAAL